MKLFKNYVKKNKTRIIIFITIFCLLIPSLFYYSLYKTFKFIENHDKQIASDNWEIGYFQGQNDGYNVAYDEFYDKLSTNPKVSYLFKKYFPNQEEARVMRAISLAESKGIQTAVNTANRNGSKDFGFFQINTVHRKKGETTEQFLNRVCNLEENFKEARRVLDKQSFTAWSTYNNLTYLQYMK